MLKNRGPGSLFAILVSNITHFMFRLRKDRMQGSVRFRTDGNRLLQVLLLGLLLAVVTLTLYWPVQSFDFVNYDDDVYVTDNGQVKEGLSMEGLKKSFTTFHAGNWHPLTMISHTVDFAVYGFNAGGHHWTSVLIHTASAVLLLLVLTYMTGMLWCSALVAALFAIHPVHVESVAWISERKDVLSGFFWILAMGAYALYVKHPTIRRYLFVMLSLVLALLSKPMAVTLPFVFLLLDYWPLRRFTDTRTAFDRWQGRDNTASRAVAMRLVLEKLPLFLMAAVSIVMTLIAQKDAGAVWSIEKMPIAVRSANALVSYMEYVRMMFWPADFAVLYPHAGVPVAWKIGVAIIFLASISFLSVRKARELPFLLVGWLWYLGTLVPVIGIVQVGSQSMADRYTYIPLVGLFIALAWGVKSLVEKRPVWNRPLAAFFIILLSGLFFLTRSQIETWKNSVTLFEQALAATEVNPMAHQKIGEFYLDQNDCGRAVPHFLKAIEMKENYAYAFHGLGVCASRETPPAGALYFFGQALQIDPQLSRTLVSRGALLIKLRRHEEAEEDFRKLLRMDPSHEAAHTNLGLIFIHLGKLRDAEVHLGEALRVNPQNAEALNNLGLIRMEQGRADEAIVHFRQALTLAPQNTAIERNLQQVVVSTAK
jgi:Flp pilus assembly protein TadD